MRTSILLFLPLFAACQDAGVTKFNANPDAVITSHVDGDTVQEGTPELLTGQVGDADDGVADLNVTWTVGGAEVCPESEPAADGAVSCEATFDVDAGAVILAVSDPDGAGASATVNLSVQATGAPVANLTEPTAEGRFYAAESIAFRGTVEDTEDAIADLSVNFETDDLGDLGLDIEVTSEGEVEAFGTLPEGEHAVRLRVVDTDGKEGIDSVVINVGPANSAPECTITAPEDDSAGPEGEEVRFEGTATDVDISADALTASWESDVDGPLRIVTPTSDGAVGFAISDLSAETHRITLTVTDDLGATCTQAIYYTVSSPPTVTITDPDDGDTVSSEAFVVFKATVDDEEDDKADLNLKWDMDGEVLTEARFDELIEGGFTLDGKGTDSFAGGTRVFTLTVTDTDGLSVSDSITLNVNEPPNAPTVTISPDPAYTSDNLFASATGSEDPDASGSVTFRYVWFEDGVELPDVTGAEFPRESTSKNHVYRVEVFASDGLHESDAGIDERTISNTAPEITDISVTPDAAPAGTTISCAASGTDVDDDIVDITYSWSDGTEGTTATIPVDAIVGDTLTCTAIASDGDGGTNTATATTIVTNNPPVMGTVMIDPTSGKVGDELTCTATATDPDADTTTITYEWSSGDVGSTYIITAEDAPGDTITCSATATDPTGASDSGTATATVENTAPVMGTVSISPEAPNNDDTLTCSASASDADGETPSISYAWSTGESSESITLTDATPPGSDISCTATATDADGASDNGSATVTVINRAPTIDEISIEPASGAVGETLSCTATASDPDGEATTLAYTWSTGTEGSTHTIDGDDPETITCTATATDASGASGSDSATATVDNTDPVMGGVSITPEDPTNDNTLTCSASATDADGETPSITYAWSTGATGAMLALTSATRPGDEITCTATATDTSGGSDSGTASVTVTNRPPTIASVTISPEAPKTGDEVTCAASGEADPDGEDVTLSYAWTINGDPAGTGTSLSTATNKDDEITCTVTATDEFGDIATASDTVTVGNTAPELLTAALTPSPALTNDVLSVDYSTTDADGDAVSVSYSWYKNDEALSTAETLSGVSSFDKGDEIRVTVTPSDESEAGSPVSVGPITIQNSPPTAPTLSISAGAECDPDFTLEFNGLDSHLVAGPPAIDGNNSRTVMAWVYLDEMGSLAQNIVTLGDGTVSRGRFSLFVEPTRKLVIIGQGYDFNTGHYIEEGEWIHVTATHNGSTLNVYVNGVNVASASRSYNTRNEEVVVGRNSLSRADGEWWNGHISEVKIWGRPLSEVDIRSEMDKGIRTSAADLRAYLPLDDGSGSTAYDESGSGLHASIHGAEWVRASPFECEADPSIVCSIDEASTDDDGDPITYTFDWDVDGSAYPDTDTTTYDGDTISGDALGHDELWTCEVTPNDGEDNGDYGSASILVDKKCSAEGDYADFEIDAGCPVAHWDMETLTASGDVADLIEDVDLVIYGGPTAGVGGVSGTTYEMNSCGDFFMSDTAYPASLVGSGPKSISAWAYLGSKGGDGDGQQPLVSFGGGGSVCDGTAFAVNYTTEGSGEDSPMLGTCSRDLRTSGPFWYLEDWYHIVGTYDGDTLRLYSNGVEIGSKPESISTSTTFDKVGVGVDTWWSAGSHWLCDGRVDEVKLYDYALSGEEAQDLYELHAGGLESCDRDGDIDCPARSCLEILEGGHSRGSDQYWLDPDGWGPFLAYCDMDTDGGGWTLVGSWTSYGGYAMRDFTDGREIDRVRSSITSPEPHHGDGPAHYSESVINALFNNGNSEYLSLTGTHYPGGYILVRFLKDSTDADYDAFHGVYHTWYMQENGFTAAYLRGPLNGNPLPLGSIDWTPVEISARDLGDDWAENYHYLPDDITDPHQWLFRENADDTPAREITASSNVPSLLLIR